MSDIASFLAQWAPAEPAPRLAMLSEPPPTLTQAQILAIAEESRQLGEEFDRRTAGMDGRRPNVLHSSESVRWFTPAPFVEAARDVLGRFDVDPASEPIANETVRATRIITQDEDGVVAPWRLDGQPPVTVWLNPPGGKYGSATGTPGAKGAGNRSLAGLFWERLLREVAAGNVEGAVFLAFNLELLQTTQNKSVPALGEYACCVPKKRIAFDRPGQKAASPTHGNVFAYVPGTIDRTDVFFRRFASIGTLTKGVTV